jgi:23S rRNA pseudouridine1911/1915/1917 synthase
MNDHADRIAIYVVPDEAAKERLDTFIASRAPDWVSRSRVKADVKGGHVSVNGVVATSPNHRLSATDRVQWIVPEPEDPTPQAENIPLEVAYEDDQLIVVNKPAGMVVHPAAGNWSGTLVNALLHHCGDSLSGIGGVRRPGIVHRLDKDTSGLLVVAKTDRAHQALAKQFADHGRQGPLTRSYQALLWGKPEPASGRVETFIGRDRGNRLKRAVVNEGAPDAKLAITHYRQQQSWRIGDDDKRKPMDVSLVECQLETGRTHQIRVHMAHLRCPLVGDATYGANMSTRVNRLPGDAQEVFSAFKRQALHAATLGFAHPVTGETLELKAALPADFEALIQALS